MTIAPLFWLSVGHHGRGTTKEGGRPTIGGADGQGSDGRLGNGEMGREGAHLARRLPCRLEHGANLVTEGRKLWQVTGPAPWRLQRGAVARRSLLLLFLCGRQLES